MGNKCRQVKEEWFNKKCAEMERMNVIDMAGMQRRNNRIKDVLTERLHKIEEVKIHNKEKYIKDETNILENASTTKERNPQWTK